MTSKAVALLFAAAILACAEAPPANSESNCEWSQTASRNPSLAGREGGLTRDAERAEDLAIRYADACCGPHSGNFESMSVWGRKRDECMAKLVRIIARIDGVTEGQIRSSLTKRAPRFDLAVILSFGMLYTLAAYFVVGWLLARHSRDGGGSVTGVMALYTCAVLSAAGVLSADVWSLALESVRLGSGHLSDRTYRVPWARHRPALFIAMILVFWIVAAFRYTGQFRQARSS